MLKRIALEPTSRIVARFQEAERISPDKHDSAYFALALELGCPIWSNDRRLKTQREVEVLDTAEVIRLLGKQGATRQLH